MFTAMLSRHHVLIGLPALGLALGVGWLSYELGRGRFADNADSVVRAPASEEPAGQATGPETQAPPSGADQKTGAPPAPGEPQRAGTGKIPPAASPAAPQPQGSSTADIIE